MNNQVFMDMDGVLVDFESGVLKYMNETMARHNGNLDDPLYKLARSTAKEIGGWDVEISRWHIARPDSSEDSFPRNYRTRDFMYRLVEDDVELWENLEWERNGKKLWDYAKNIPGIQILSAPMAEGSRKGKILWVERELGLGEELINLSDTKEPFGTHNGKQGLLIDDRDKYINQFVSGGGVAIKHNPDDVDNTIKQLQELGY